MDLHNTLIGCGLVVIGAAILRRSREKQPPERPTSLSHIEQLAQQILPSFIYQYYSYTADSQQQPNRHSFDQITLWTRVLTGNTQISTELELFGRILASPVILAPTAFHRLCHDDGELGTARGAAAAGACYIYPFMLSTVSCHEVAAVDGPRWAHVYILQDREYVLHTLALAERLGFEAVVVTVDHPHERVKRHTLPAFDRNINSCVRGVPLREYMQFPNLDEYKKQHNLPMDDDSIGDNDSALNWSDLAWLVNNTRLPVIAKGVLHPEDAARAVECGCKGIIVSNHGGRQFGAAVAAIDALPAVVRTCKEVAPAGQRVAILLDSGVRRGSDVVKAIALGADAVLIGRPVLWGLATAGEAGVQWVLDHIRTELADDMASVGCATLADIGTHVLYASPPS